MVARSLPPACDPAALDLMLEMEGAGQQLRATPEQGLVQRLCDADIDFVVVGGTDDRYIRGLPWQQRGHGAFKEILRPNLRVACNYGPQSAPRSDRKRNTADVGAVTNDSRK